MSGWGEMYRDQLHREWLHKWVPSNDDALDDCPDSFRDQYRYVLARARDAEASVKDYRITLAQFKRLLGT